MSRPALKPCPFCASEKVSMGVDYDHDGSNTTWRFIQCRDCGSRGKSKWHSPGNDCPLFYEEIRDAWNRRDLKPPPQMTDHDTRTFFDLEMGPPYSYIGKEKQNEN